MPARVVRSEINASDSMSRVSMMADLTFRALIVAVDDFGRIDGRLAVVKAALFPLRDEVTLKKLDAWLEELAAGPDAPIARYVVDGRPYIALTGWEKHRGQGRRGRTSKCPEPLPRKSEEVHADPPGKQEAGDENRETRDERREPASASSESPALPARVRRISKTPVPEFLSSEDTERVEDWARRRSPPISDDQLRYGWEVFRAQARSKGYVYADHAQAFQNALGATGNAWALKGYGMNPTGEAESPAQAKARRTKEAGAKAYEMIQQSQQRKLGLIEGGAA